MTLEEKQAARVKAQQYADLSETGFVDPHPELDEPPSPPPPNPDTALSNEELIKMLNERAGITLSSIDDLKPKQTEEEIQAIKEKRNADMVAYGLSTGKFKKEDYDTFQRLTDNKLMVIKDELTQKFTDTYPEFSPEAIEEKVANYMFEHLDENDPTRKQRENELLELADIRLQSKYKNIYSLENDFEQHEQGLTNKANFDRKVQAALPVYKQDVQTAISGLSSFDIVIPDTQNPANDVPVKVKFSEADLQEVMDAFLAPDTIVQNIKSGINADAIKEMAEQVLVKKHLPRLISQAAKDYNSIQKDKYIRGTKGTMPNQTIINVSDDDLKESKDKLYGELIDSARADGIKA